MYSSVNRTTNARQRNRLGTLVMTGIVVLIIMRWLFPGINPIRRIQKTLAHDDLKSYLELGKESLKNSNWKAGIKYFSKVIENEPANAEGYYLRGIAELKLDRKPESLADLNRAIELKPDYFEAYKYRSLYFLLNRQEEESLADLNKAIELKPSDPYALFDRGHRYRDAQKYDEAIADFTKAIEVMPKDIDLLMVYNVYYGRGSLYLSKGMVREAIADFNKVIDLVGGDFVKVIRAQKSFDLQLELAKLEPGTELYIELEDLLAKLEKTK